MRTTTIARVGVACGTGVLVSLGSLAALLLLALGIPATLIAPASLLVFAVSGLMLHLMVSIRSGNCGSRRS